MYELLVGVFIMLLLIIYLFTADLTPETLPTRQPNSFLFSHKEEFSKCNAKRLLFKTFFTSKPPP